MEDLREKFMEEARELLGKLEEALLDLEANPADESQINEVFRVMHSLKGTGAMFGFDALSEQTHELESVYDRVRNNELPLSKELLDITFQSIDLINNLLLHDDDQEVLKQKALFTEKLRSRFLDDEPESVLVAPTAKKRAAAGQATYYIHFQPGEGVLKDGTHPLYLIDELLDLGKGKVFMHSGRLPEFDKLVPDLAYLYWDFLLATSETESNLRDVFIFVEDNSLLEIKKIADFDLLSKNGFDKEVEKLQFGEKITQDKLNKLVKTLQAKKETKKKVSPKARPVETDTDQTVITARKIHEEVPSVRISSSKLDNMMDLVSELVTNQARLEHLGKQLDNPELHRLVEDFDKLFRMLRSNALEMRLIPIYNLVTRFKRLVRDLSKDLGKQVVLKTTGTETELDKSVIEMLYDPLMHIIRNCLDHGIETPEVRKKSGKDPEGNIEIVTYYSGSNVVIEVKDDGKGIDAEELRKKAIEKKIITTGDQMSQEDLLNLVFHPGFSTSSEISQISGRGVGLDVVRKNITALRGYVEMNSVKGAGTIVRIRLPLTLSIIDGLLVNIGKSRYLVPLENISHVYPLLKKELENTDFSRVVIKDGKQIQFVDLISEFENAEFEFDKGFLLVFRFDQKEIGFVINGIMGKHQAVIKPLNEFIRGKELFSGATVLGDGKVALVIDPYRMMQQYINI